MALTDAAGIRYETLRREFLAQGAHHPAGDWERFCGRGLVGLLSPEHSRDYIVEVYPAVVRRWWGRINPQEQALRETFRLLIGEPRPAQSDPGAYPNEDRLVCTGINQTARKTRHH